MPVSLLLSWAGVVFGLLACILQFRNARRLHNMRSTLRYMAAGAALYCAVIYLLIAIGIVDAAHATMLLRPALITILSLLAAFAIVEI
jgi:hypothetical protein